MSTNEGPQDKETDSKEGVSSDKRVRGEEIGSQDRQSSVVLGQQEGTAGDKATRRAEGGLQHGEASVWECQIARISGCNREEGI